jgi:hypothetical protein
MVNTHNHTRRIFSSSSASLPSSYEEGGYNHKTKRRSNMNKKTNLIAPMKKKSKKGNLMTLPMNLLMLFITVTFLVALIPGLVEIINTAQQSDSLNCAGYKYNGDATHALSYNSTIGTQSSIGCLAIKLYIPYIVLGVLISGVALIFYGRTMGDQQQQAY